MQTKEFRDRLKGFIKLQIDDYIENFTQKSAKEDMHIVDYAVFAGSVLALVDLYAFVDFMLKDEEADSDELDD